MMLYKSKINLTIKNNSHTLSHEAVERILFGRTGKVLEVGCSVGYFGESLKSLGHYVWGIEPHEEAALEASKVLDRVYVGDVASFFVENPSELFDVIVFGDVLEHIADPVSVLKTCRNHLTYQGKIIASIPNVSHLAIRAMLLEGRWNYSDLGILDRTHLRFFTRSSAIDLFSDSGYVVQKISSIRLLPDQVDEICKLKLDKKILEKTQEIIKDDHGFDFQYVLEAEVSQNANQASIQNQEIKNRLGFKLVCLSPDPDLSLTEIRFRQPLERWALRFSGHFRLVSYSDLTMDDLLWGDIFVIQRETNHFISQLIVLLKMHRKNVIFEIDDLLCDLPQFLSHHSKAFEKTRHYFERALHQVDAVTVTTRRLGEALAKKGGKTFVIPNCTETHSFEQTSHFQVQPHQVSLIIASSDRIQVGFVIPALIEIQKKLGIKILAVGPLGQILLAAGLDVEIHEMMSYALFKEFIGKQKNTIGLIPLEDSLFSSCKSPIKYLDFSLASIPSICSNVPPYSDVVINGENGLLSSNSKEDLIQAIESLVLDVSKRIYLSSSARQMVKEVYNLDIASQRWQNLLTDLVPDIKTSRENCIEIPSSAFKFLYPNKLNFFLDLIKIPFRLTAYKKALEILRTKGFSAVIVKIKSKIAI
jgi:2-polyprenyl-3-methyl-5-hydroxy-6-metoxy-1,4-benzoquinol methylase/glycosyltransferase involved in cell wall biosynthesis